MGPMGQEFISTIMETFEIMAVDLTFKLCLEMRNLSCAASVEYLIPNSNVQFVLRDWYRGTCRIELVLYRRVGIWVPFRLNNDT